MLSRRGLLALGGAALTTLIAPPTLAATFHPKRERTLHLYNTHTGESVRTVYWSEGHYLPQRIKTLNHLMRDHRANQAHAIDPHVYDLLFALQRTLATKQPFLIISGYRSPATNAWLRAHSDGVAGNSLHMQGKAVDIRVPGLSVQTVGRAARGLKIGGVGMYPSSDFVHVDTGHVRTW